MLDHIGFAVADLARAQAFYDTALAPLGIGALLSFSAEQTGSGDQVGYGSNDKAYFWIGTGGAPLSGRLHVAFVAPDRETVDAFYAAAMSAGGRDNGAPGVRAHYHPDYYGAFVLDPDGHNVEAVCHAPG
jgi:catechol 2,3-dioxygenase-like lactoylglutathione lyase family enzyme